MLRVQRKKKTGFALLYSTDAKLEAMILIKYYKARFQIEFAFRDAKQYTGLLDCQSCRKESIHTQISASFSALNLLKLEDLREKKKYPRPERHLDCQLEKAEVQPALDVQSFDYLGLSLSSDKVMDTYEQLSGYGAIAA